MNSGRLGPFARVSPTRLPSMLFSKGDPTPIVSAAEPTTAESACPASGQGARKPLIIQLSRPARAMQDFARFSIRSLRTKTEILGRSEVDFCTPRNQQVAGGGANRFWNAARCVHECARREKMRLLHTKKETEYSYTLVFRAHISNALFCTRAFQPFTARVLHSTGTAFRQ